MLLPSLVTIGSVALTANAFLIPGDVDITNTDAFKAPESLQSGDGQTVKINCENCPFALTADDGSRSWKQDIANDLVIDIKTDGDTLTFDGVPVYPLKVPGFPPILEVTQASKEASESTSDHGENRLALSYSLEADEEALSDGNTLVNVLITILDLHDVGLDPQFVRIDNLGIEVVKDSQGKLTLHSVAVVQANPNDPDAKCNNVLCRVLTKIHAAFEKAKSQTKKVGHKVKCFCVKCVKCFRKFIGLEHPQVNKESDDIPHDSPEDTVELPSHNQVRPAGHSHPHPHHGQHGFFAKVRHVMMIAAVPILLGLCFGFAAGAIGMLVGQLVVFLWVRYRRTDRTTAYMPLEVDEKEVPPPYEDAPSAEATSEKEVDARA